MSTVHAKLIGGLGNRMFIWSHAKSFCEQNNHELRTDEWVGEKIFTLDGHKPKRPDGSEDIVLSGYFQNQESLIYSRADCRRWFKLRPEVEEMIHHRMWFPVAHFRRGDYVGSSGYPLVGKGSVDRAVREFLFPGENHRDIIPDRHYHAVSDAHPGTLEIGFPGELSFFPDFYMLMKAPVLFRGNSSFSWWAATLGTGRVFSPLIAGFAGGVEHDNVPFVEGNWPRLAELDFVTDLHLREV